MSLWPPERALLDYRGPAEAALLTRSVLADRESPVAAWSRLGGGDGRPSFLLESVVGGEQVARYSFLSAGVTRSLRAEARPGDDLRALVRAAVPCRALWCPPEAPRFVAGAVGMFGFDCVRSFEAAPTAAGSDLGALPDVALLLPEVVVAFDHARRRLLLMTLVELGGDAAARAAAYAHGRAALAETLARLSDGPLPPALVEPELGAAPLPLAARANQTPEAYQAAVRAAREAIAAGEVFQVVLSQRLDVSCQLDPLTLYRALRAVNPSPFLFLLDFGDFALVGASPEVLVRVEDGEVLVSPIAGTRRRDPDPARDAALEAELRGCAKELAEHRMLVDLGRNDVGRVAAPGSVRVEGALRVERYSHVMHLVSDVRGRLAPGLDALDALAAAFPAGTLSGAPKLRALELIAALEPDRRGPYGGAVGYLDVRGNLDTAIAIRTAVVQPGLVSVQAGAGVVHDSRPEAEHAECRAKAEAVLAAVRWALAAKEAEAEELGGGERRGRGDDAATR